MQVDTRLQDIYYTGREEEPEEEEEEEEKTEEELEQEAEEDEEAFANAKSLSYDVSFQECPICTHPYLAHFAKNNADQANVMGMVAKGANIYRPIVYNDNGDRGTPRTILGAELCKIISCIPTFRVKITNITYGYSQHSNPEKSDNIGGGTPSVKPQVGDTIRGDQLPGKNKFGTPQTGGGSASTDASSGTTIITFVGRNATYEKGKWQVQERYLIEEIPSLDEVKDRAAKAAQNS